MAAIRRVDLTDSKDLQTTKVALEKYLQVLNTITLIDTAVKVDETAKKELFRLCNEVSPLYCALSDLGEQIKWTYTLLAKSEQSTDNLPVHKWDIFINPSYIVGTLAAI